MTAMELDASAFVAENELVSILLGRSTPVACPQDRVLFRQGDAPAGLFIVNGGTVKMTMEADGKVVLEIQAGPGSLLGLPGLVGNQEYSLSAMASKGAEIGFVRRDDFSALMLSEPSVAMMVLRVLAAEVRTARMAAAQV